MKKYIIPFLIVCTLWCSCSEDMSVDPTIMPPPTTEGLNTFGCLINGWIYAGGRFSKPHAQYVPASEEQEEYIQLNAEIADDEYISFHINKPADGRTVTYTNTTYSNNGSSSDMENGTVHITRFDTKQHIISGTFEGGDIKEGRFDLYYSTPASDQGR